MENGMDLMPRFVQLEAVWRKPFLFDDLEWTISFIVKFLQWSFCFYVCGF